MCLGIGRHHQVVHAERGHERLLRERRIVVVVDEQVIEQGSVRRRHCRLRAADQRGEVHDAIGVEHVQVVAIEARELAPARESARLGPRLDLFRREASLLRSQQELTDLVGEPSQGEEVAVRGPLGRVLPLEQVLHERELIRRREHVRRLGVAERGEPLAKDQMAETVERQDLEAGERRGETCDERVARDLARATRSHHERHPLRVCAALHQPSEPLAEHRGLPGARNTGHQECTRPMGEDGLLPSIEGQRGAHKADATASRRHPRGRAEAGPRRSHPAPRRRGSAVDTTGRRPSS